MFKWLTCFISKYIVATIAVIPQQQHSIKMGTHCLEVLHLPVAFSQHCQLYLDCAALAVHHAETVSYHNLQLNETLPVDPYPILVCC